MTITVPEFIESPINDALVEFTGCIGAAFDDICSYGLTIGDSYVPFDADEDNDTCEEEEEDGAVCSQVWVRVMSVTPSAASMESWTGDTSAISVSLNIEVGVLRCMEVMEEGEAPTESQVLVAALQAMDDMRAILCAALGCEVWDALNVGNWSPFGPMGGQYGGTWSFIAEIA